MGEHDTDLKLDLSKLEDGIDYSWNITNAVLWSQFDDGDMLAPWAAFQSAHERKQPIPEWCLVHLGNCVKRLLEGPTKNKGDEGNSDFIAGALGLKKHSGGRGPWVTREMNERLEPALCELIHQANKLPRRGDGSFKGIGDLYEKIYKEFNIGRTTLEKAFREFYKDQFHFNKNHKK